MQVAIVPDDRRLGDRVDRHVVDRAGFLMVERTGHEFQCAPSEAEPIGVWTNWCTLVTTVTRSDPITNRGERRGVESGRFECRKGTLGWALPELVGPLPLRRSERKGV